ncbi:MAG: glycoside hydrolase family 92 protein [Cytophagales bacterium]|nr:glycoside hydrolase family 92 protein [Cytophagales bacterium]
MTIITKTDSHYCDEQAQAGFYSVFLEDPGVRAELSATPRSTLYQFTFPAGSASNLIFDISEGLSPSRDSYVEVLSPTEIAGWNQAGGFCRRDNHYRIHFVAQVSKTAKTWGTWVNREIKAGQASAQGTSIGAYLQFETEPEEVILVKIGLSYVSIENARANLLAEQPAWSLDEVKSKAQAAWNQQLGKVQVQGGNEADKTKFYTALFHSLIHPNIIDDANGEYPALTSYRTKKVTGRHQYTVFSLWDTYRTLHPLLTLAYPEVQTQILQTMADMVAETGWLPFWELAAGESYVMNGDPAAPVVADSYAKGLRDFDTTLVVNALLRQALDTTDNAIRWQNRYYTRHGYLPIDDCGPDDEWGKIRMVSVALEYAYADWCTAQMARALGKDSLAQLLEQRSKTAYQHYFNPETLFLTPRSRNGQWYEAFRPESYHGSWNNLGFVEGNSWQYTFFVPHDMEGLKNLMGGDSVFAQHLQRCFDEKNFTIDNEPDLAYPYLFTYVPGQEWRTQRLVHELIVGYFDTDPGGLPGNDDAGTISAWLVFSAMGIYPDCPGSTRYRLGSPLFDQISLALDPRFYTGQTLTIRKTSPKAYPLKAYWNGVPLDTFAIDHGQLTQGGVLLFEKEK